MSEDRKAELRRNLKEEGMIGLIVQYEQDIASYHREIIDLQCQISNLQIELSKYRTSSEKTVPAQKRTLEELIRELQNHGEVYLSRCEPGEMQTVDDPSKTVCIKYAGPEEWKNESFESLYVSTANTDNSYAVSELPLPDEAVKDLSDNSDYWKKRHAELADKFIQERDKHEAYRKESEDTITNLRGMVQTQVNNLNDVKEAHNNLLFQLERKRNSLNDLSKTLTQYRDKISHLENLRSEECAIIRQFQEEKAEKDKRLEDCVNKIELQRSHIDILLKSANTHTVDQSTVHQELKESKALTASLQENNNYLWTIIVNLCNVVGFDKPTDFTERLDELFNNMYPTKSWVSRKIAEATGKELTGGTEERKTT